MKKTFPVLFAGSLLFAAANVNAQQNAFAVNNSVSEYGYSDAKDEVKSIDIDDVNAEALTDFTTKHKEATDVKWTAGNKTISVYFKQNDVPMRSTYTEKGKLQYTVSYYLGSHVPQKFRNLAVRQHYHMDVKQVTELQYRHRTVELVRLEDANTVLNARIEGNELVPYETLNKN
jgi:hypothetical protein